MLIKAKDGSLYNLQDFHRIQVDRHSVGLGPVSYRVEGHYAPREYLTGGTDSRHEVQQTLPVTLWEGDSEAEARTVLNHILASSGGTDLSSFDASSQDVGLDPSLSLSQEAALEQATSDQFKDQVG